VLKLVPKSSSAQLETQEKGLTEREIRACELARSIREAFSDAEVDEIKAELEAEGDETS
jgi:hypothetical protein